MGDKDVVASEGILHWPIPTYDKLTYEDFLVSLSWAPRPRSCHLRGLGG